MVVEVSEKVNGMSTCFLHQSQKKSWCPFLSSLWLNVAPAICAVFIAPQVDWFRACSCAGVTSSPWAIEWYLSSRTASLSQLVSRTGPSILCSFHHFFIAMYPPCTVLRSLWHLQPAKIKSRSKHFSHASRSSNAPFLVPEPHPLLSLHASQF